MAKSLPPSPNLEQLKKQAKDLLKEMCSMDLQDRSHPQNGRIYLKCAGRSLDFRVSIMPYVGGESAVVRIMDRANTMVGLDETEASADQTRVPETLAIDEIERAIQAINAP